MAPINEGRYTTSPVTPLAASEATSHLQDGDVDVQGSFVVDASIPERPDPVRCSCSASAIFRRPAAVCCKNTNWICTADILSCSSIHLQLGTAWH